MTRAARNLCSSNSSMPLASEPKAMSQEHDPSPASSTPLRRPKPAGLRELSPRAIFCGLVVAALMGASYPYIVLKLGFGPNVSVVAAIFGYILLGLLAAWIVPLVG